MNFIKKSYLLKSFLLTCLILFRPEVSIFAQNRPSAEQVTFEKKLIEGKKYTLLGDWEKAEAIFRAILQEDVQNSAACYELSRTLAASGKSSEALTYIRKAIRIEPDNEWYQLMEADIHEKAGDLFAAMEVYDKLILLRPQKAHYYEMQINFCKKTGEQERLLKVLDNYEGLRGITESITRSRFETLDALGKTDEALSAIQRLTEVFPSNTEYKFLAASYAKKIGKEDIALQYYKDVLLLDSENSRAKLALASTEKKAGDNSGYLQSIMPVITNPAIDIDIKIQELIPFVVEFSKSKDNSLGTSLLDISKQLVISHPKEAKAFALQADILSILRQDEAAIASYKTATSLNSGVYIIWEQMLNLLIINRAYADVHLQAQLAMDHFPNQAFLYYASGLGLYKTKKFDASLDMLNQALIMTGRNVRQKISVYNILGLVYDELGDLEKSSIAFESALSTDPNNAETLAYYSLVLSRRIAQSEKAFSMTSKVLSQGNLVGPLQEILAQVLYNQKKYSEANVSIQKVLVSDPHGDAFNLAGDILLKLGNTSEAVTMWQRALEKGCMDPEIKEKISDHKAQ